jgi:predicted secreted protein
MQLLSNWMSHFTITWFLVVGIIVMLGTIYSLRNNLICMIVIDNFHRQFSSFHFSQYFLFYMTDLCSVIIKQWTMQIRSIYLFIYLFIYSFIHLFIYLFIYLFIILSFQVIQKRKYQNISPTVETSAPTSTSTSNRDNTTPTGQYILQFHFSEYLSCVALFYSDD